MVEGRSATSYLRGVEELDDSDKVYFAAQEAAFHFAAACAKFRDSNQHPNIVPLEDIINTLMTELWDRGFSQSEIRSAFQSALNDMDRYAAGAERR
jgi:SOS response regulatory protein OraA/RecX